MRPSKAGSSCGIFSRSRPLANSAISAGVAFPSASAVSICIPETPKASLATLASFDVGRLQHLQQPVALRAPTLYQLAPVAGQVAQFANGLGGYKARSQQSMQQQI